jgi:hypothetical protein
MHIRWHVYLAALDLADAYEICVIGEQSSGNPGGRSVVGADLGDGVGE